MKKFLLSTPSPSSNFSLGKYLCPQDSKAMSAAEDLQLLHYEKLKFLQNPLNAHYIKDSWKK